MTARIVGLLAIGAVLVGTAFAWKDSAEVTEEGRSQATPVEVTVLDSVDSYRLAYEYTGTIVAGQASELGFERAGKLTKLVIDEGQRVTKGDEIAWLDMRQLSARREQLRSQLEEAKARLKLLENGPRTQTIAAAKARVRSIASELKLQQSNFKRRSDLYQSNAVSREELDETRFGFQSLQARLDEAQERLNELLAGTRIEEISAQRAVVDQLHASLQSVEVELEDSVLRAPFSGTITARYADEGTVAQLAQPILRIVDDTIREAHIGVPPEVALDMQVGQTMVVTASGTSWPARSRSILPELNPVTRTQTVVLEIERPSGSALPVPGEIARIQVERQLAGSGYWVPSTALERGQRGLWAVFAVEQDDNDHPVVKRRDVEVIVSRENAVLVRGTLVEGERIVASGIHRLVPGQHVEMIN